MKLEDLKGKLDIDVEGSLMRFAGMEKIYIKYLKKLGEDKNFPNLREAVQNGDLKGV